MRSTRFIQSKFDELRASDILATCNLEDDIIERRREEILKAETLFPRRITNTCRLKRLLNVLKKSTKCPPYIHHQQSDDGTLTVFARTFVLTITDEGRVNSIQFTLESIELLHMQAEPFRFELSHEGIAVTLQDILKLDNTLSKAIDDFNDLMAWRQSEEYARLLPQLRRANEMIQKRLDSIDKVYKKFCLLMSLKDRDNYYLTASWMSDDDGNIFVPLCGDGEEPIHIPFTSFDFEQVLLKLIDDFEEKNRDFALKVKKLRESGIAAITDCMNRYGGNLADVTVRSLGRMHAAALSYLYYVAQDIRTGEDNFVHKSPLYPQQREQMKYMLEVVAPLFNRKSDADIGWMTSIYFGGLPYDPMVRVECRIAMSAINDYFSDESRFDVTDADFRAKFQAWWRVTMMRALKWLKSGDTAF